MIRIFFFVLLTATGLFAQQEFQPASACGECHEVIYQQWLNSKHAKSTLQHDAIYKGMYDWAMEDTQGKLQKNCISCHAPMSTVFHSFEADTNFNEDGVTCQFCHSASDISGSQSPGDIQIDLTAVYSDNPAPANEEHPVNHRDFFAKSDICLPCHAQMKTPTQLEACATGFEWESFYEKTQKTCQDCHMPSSEPGNSHQFPGTHVGELLKNSVEMQLNWKRDKNVLSIFLLNISAGHALPTGTPLRMVMLKVNAYDGQGELVWENWKQNPIKEDKQALFMKILADSTGNGPVPPWQATQITYDRRLLPDLPEHVEYTIPVQNITKIDATLLYRFAPPPILKRFGITAPELSKPKVIVQKSLEVSG